MTEKPVVERDLLALVPTPPADDDWRTREPLVPPEVDLHDFPYMPLDIQRLLTSETWIKAAGRPIAHTHVTLWCKSWRQIPAASLPDKDFMLARYAMLSAPDWQAAKAEALTDWIKCEDARWYHPVVAELAIEAWHKSRKKKFLTANARTALRQKREAQKALINGHSVCYSDCYSDSDNPRREGKGREEITPPRARARGNAPDTVDAKGGESRAPIDSAFEQFWEAAPKRTGRNPKAAAKKHFTKAVKGGADPATLVAAARAWREQESRKGEHERQFIPAVRTWLADESWKEPALPVATPKHLTPGNYL